MAAKKKDDGPAVMPMIRVAPLGELRVYMVTEEELDTLGRGSPGSILLNFALALLSFAVAFLMALLTTTVPSLAVLVFFICACIIGFLVGLICLVLAWKNHTSTKNVVERIKQRMPPSAPTDLATSDTGTVSDSAQIAKSSEPAPAGPS